MKLLRQWKNAEAFVNLNRICRQKKIWNRLLKLDYMLRMAWENRQPSQLR